ncbi:hypothetical protein E2493_02855 [Sphingomonas parva]|uniref:SRPBCC domain-containing protein n=1 Tax=Sphingomonas parva TaxID=2555898 RepID=A0A4Y8ZUT6_9SPHN|nr:SRPBCC family protein [Sphingomonas parva]TFI59793.1 hypothetical protein E2493_02855 [Sphingomonas parva]
MMIDVVEEIDIPASQHKVWTALTDFSSYKKWHPYVRIDGSSLTGEKVRYTFVRNSRGKLATTEATLSVCSAPREIDIEIGWERVLLVTEWYLLEPVRNGVRLKHGLRFSGLLASLAGPILRRCHPDWFYLRRPIVSLRKYLARSRGDGDARRRRQSAARTSSSQRPLP